MRRLMRHPGRDLSKGRAGKLQAITQVPRGIGRSETESRLERYVEILAEKEYEVF
jgi:hypothetical protein